MSQQLLISSYHRQTDLNVLISLKIFHLLPSALFCISHLSGDFFLLKKSIKNWQIYCQNAEKSPKCNKYLKNQISDTKHPSCVEQNLNSDIEKKVNVFFLPQQCCSCLTGSVSSAGGCTRRRWTLTSLDVREFKTSASGSDFHLSSSKLQETCRRVSAGVSEAAALVFIVHTDTRLSRRTEDEEEDEEEVKVCMLWQPGSPPVWPGAETAAGLTHF